MIAERATEAPIIRQLFSSSPRDPRYHMLTYISAKFSQPQRALTHEPRAALFLNRFTRTLTIMYATNGMANVLGITADELNGKSFYYCIQENCLQEAVKCLESAKANDSIAYLRFWFRDPREEYSEDHDEIMSDTHSSDEDDGGVHLNGQMDTQSSDHNGINDHTNSGSRSSVENGVSLGAHGTSIGGRESMERSSSGNSTDLDGNAANAIFDQNSTVYSSTSSLSSSVPGQSRENPPSHPVQTPAREIELEAVVSCTSDGLVVVLRAARPFLPNSVRLPHRTTEPAYVNGLFASPWAMQPIMPESPGSNGFPYQDVPAMPKPSQPNYSAPQSENFMQSIREVAVFAWSLTGINGSLAQYSRGTPFGEAQPPGGMPVWDPKDGHTKGAVGYYGEAPSIIQPNADAYWPAQEPQNIDRWDRNSRIRQWNGQQQLLSVGPGIPPAVPSAMEWDADPGRYHWR